MAQITRLVTGGLVDHIVAELVQTADDSDEATKTLVKEGLLDIGKRKPVMTLSTIMWTICNKVCVQLNSHNQLMIYLSVFISFIRFQ